MSSQTYNLTQEELAYGEALQQSIEAVKATMVQALNVPDVFSPEKGEYSSEIEDLAHVLATLSELHKEVYTLKSKEEK